jgi:hypothetical protein
LDHPFCFIAPMRSRWGAVDLLFDRQDAPHG